MTFNNIVLNSITNNNLKSGLNSRNYCDGLRVQLSVLTDTAWIFLLQEISVWCAVTKTNAPHLRKISSEGYTVDLRGHLTPSHLSRLTDQFVTCFALIYPITAARAISCRHCIHISWWAHTTVWIHPSIHRDRGVLDPLYSIIKEFHQIFVFR